MAALGSVASALVLVTLKVFLAVFTGSLGILSEALHSILDLVAAVITYLSVRVADKPADAEHLYGHGKVESFSAFVETGLLLLTAVYIIWEAFQRLLFRTATIRLSLSVIVILGLTMGIDFVRSRALRRVAKKYPSEALEADALHFSTDVWSTFVVVLGITGAWLGERFGIRVARHDGRGRRARRGRRDHLDRIAARQAHDRRAARRGAQRPARPHRARGRPDRRRAEHRARARAPRRPAAISSTSRSACRARPASNRRTPPATRSSATSRRSSRRTWWCTWSRARRRTSTSSTRFARSRSAAASPSTSCRRISSTGGSSSSCISKWTKTRACAKRTGAPPSSRTKSARPPTRTRWSISTSSRWARASRAPQR